MAAAARRQQQSTAIDERPLLLTLRPLAPAFDETLSTRFRIIKPFESNLPRHEFLSIHAQAARALLVSGLATVDAALLDSLPCLGLVVTTSRGLDHIDIVECRRRGIAVAYAAEVFSEDVADFAIGLLIDVLRRVSAADRFVRRGLWPVRGDYALGSKLSGKKIGIVGLGSIGSEIARRLEAFACTIFYTSRRRKLSVPYIFFNNVYDLAKECDVLIICCALTKETHHIINKDVLEALGHGVIINFGRGGLIDEKELVRSLVERKIGGAGLDVFENEPVVPRELFEMEHVVLTPHRAVGSREITSDLLQLVVANLEAFFTNRPLLSLIPEKGSSLS